MTGGFLIYSGLTDIVLIHIEYDEALWAAFSNVLRLPLFMNQLHQGRDTVGASLGTAVSALARFCVNGRGTCEVCQEHPYKLNRVLLLLT